MLALGRQQQPIYIFIYIYISTHTHADTRARKQLCHLHMRMWLVGSWSLRERLSMSKLPVLRRRKRIRSNNIIKHLKIMTLFSLKIMISLLLVLVPFSFLSLFALFCSFFATSNRQLTSLDTENMRLWIIRKGHEIV